MWGSAAKLALIKLYLKCIQRDCVKWSHMLDNFD